MGCMQERRKAPNSHFPEKKVKSKIEKSSKSCVSKPINCMEEMKEMAQRTENSVLCREVGAGGFCHWCNLGGLTGF